MRLATFATLALSLALAVPARVRSAEEDPAERQPKPKPAAPQPPTKPKEKEAAPKPQAGELRIEAGKQQALELPGGTQVICDDTEVARPEFTADAIMLTGVKPGTTECGARLNGGFKGFWKVTVVEAGK